MLYIQRVSQCHYFSIFCRYYLKCVIKMIAFDRQNLLINLLIHIFIIVQKFADCSFTFMIVVNLPSFAGNFGTLQTTLAAVTAT